MRRPAEERASTWYICDEAHDAFKKEPLMFNDKMKELWGIQGLVMGPEWRCILASGHKSETTYTLLNSLIPYTQWGKIELPSHACLIGKVKDDDDSFYKVRPKLTREAAVTEVVNTINNLVLAGPVLVMGIDLSEIVDRLYNMAVTREITSISQAREFYSMANVENDQTIVFIGKKVYLGLDLRFVRESRAVVFSEGLLDKEELM